MFAVNHAATALVLKRRYPSVPMAPLLISVQAMELAWVALNFLGIEYTTTEASVSSAADIHLAHMPFSHSVVTAVGAALLTWFILEKGFGRAALGRAVGLGIVSHLLLDLAVHNPDIALWPGVTPEKLGSGLYGFAPSAAFVVEFMYGMFCWYIYRGSRGLLLLIGLGNLANLTLLSPLIAGPERYLAGHPIVLVALVFVQIVTTLWLVGFLARSRPAESDAVSVSRKAQPSL